MQFGTQAAHFGSPAAAICAFAQVLLQRQLFAFIKVRHAPDGTFPNGVPNPMLEENRKNLQGIAEGGNSLLHDARISRIISNTDKLLARLERDVPDMLAKGDRLLTRLDKASELFKDENLAKFDRMLANGDVSLGNLAKISGDFKDIGKELKPALVKVGPLLKNLAVIAERGAAITYDGIRRMLQVEGMRVRIAKNRKAEREIGDGDQDEAEGFQGP